MQAASQIPMARTIPTLTESPCRPWIVCFTATLFFFFEFIQGNMFNPLAPSLMKDFKIDAELLGVLAGVHFVANVLFLFPSGYLLDRYSTRKIVLLAMWVCVSATFLFAMSTNFWMVFVCRFMTGVGSAFCFLSCIRLASRWFPPRRMALITGLIVTVAMTGGMVAQEPLNLLIEQWGWRQALVIDGSVGLGIIILVALFVQDYPITRQKEMLKQREEIKKISFWQGLFKAYSKLQNVSAAIYTCLMNTPIGILGAMAGSLFLQQSHQLNSHQAAIVSMGIFAGTIVGGPLVGWLSDRISLRRLPMIIGALCSLVVIVVIMHSTSLPVWQWFALFFALGFFTSTQVLSYPTVAESNSPIMTATAVSVIGVITQGGIAVCQPFFGYLLKQSWDGQYLDQIPFYSAMNYHVALLIIPIGFVVALVASLVMKETHCRPLYKVSTKE